MGGPCTARIELQMRDEQEARALAAATRVDDPPAFTRTRVRGSLVVFEAQGPSVGSLRESADDFLRCAIAAAGAAGAAKQKPAARAALTSRRNAPARERAAGHRRQRAR